MELKEIQNDLTKSIPLLLCPFCISNIPQIFMQSLNGEIDINIKCFCSDENKK